MINFKTTDLKLSILLVEGTYPDYERVIPKNNNNRVLIDKDRLIKGLRRMLVLSSENTRGVKMEFGENRLHLSSRNPDVGEADDEFDIDFDYEGKQIIIGFNAKYLMEIAGVIDASKIYIDLSDDFAPGLIRAEEGEEGFFAVIMPMRIGF